MGIITKNWWSGCTMLCSELQDKWQSHAHYELKGCFSVDMIATCFPLYFVSSGYLFCSEKTWIWRCLCQLTLFLTKLFLCVSSANWDPSVAIWFNDLNRNLWTQTKQNAINHSMWREMQFCFCGEVKSKITELCYIAYPAGHPENWDFRFIHFCVIVSHKQSKI